MTKNGNPYQGLPARSFWRTGVVAYKNIPIPDLYVPKFRLEKEEKIATAGSCFAQHIARHLQKNGYNVLDVEPAPEGLSGREFGYNLYSARYGNIYHARQLRLLAEEAFGLFEPTGWIWQADGAFYDAFRPTIEPEGLKCEEYVLRHRQHHLKKVRQLFSTMNVFVFTLGLTEAWIRNDQQYVVPTAPGVVASPKNTLDYSFKNFRHAEIYADLQKFLSVVRAYNPSFKMVLTVSPVPLIATATSDHVLPATIYSKSVLRGVAGELAMEDPHVDYFPSYEIITGAQSGGRFFEPNLRSVTGGGVAQVMRQFFAAHAHLPTVSQESQLSSDSQVTRNSAKITNVLGSAEDVLCDEILNDAFPEAQDPQGKLHD